MQFSGALIDEPCVVAPDDTSIKLDFHTIVETYLYFNERTSSQFFTIHLQNCSIKDWPGEGTVIVHFEGSENTALPGYLATANEESGIAIGIENEGGVFLGLGKDSAPIKLDNGDVALTFGAFIKAEPEAVQNKTIALGDFSATATFFLDFP
ncbi:fimbrial protein [Kluyvera intermedia]|uniref:fimbrial protein n=1 Tax=Kluyvera intermedia TaxID=61648 RepID=UPI0035238CAE